MQSGEVPPMRNGHMDARTPPPMRLAPAQMNPTVFDLQANTAQIIALLREADRLGCQIAAFPELAITGYPPEDLLLKTRFLHGNSSYVQRIIAPQTHLRCMVTVIGSTHHELPNAVKSVEGGAT